MKVTVKMKHLVLGLSFLVVFALVLIIFIYPKIDSWQIEKQLSAGNVEEGKERIVDRIENGARNRLDLIEEYMINPVSEGYDVYVAPTMRSSPGDVSGRYFTREEMAPHLLTYLQKATPDLDGYYVNATKILVNYYQGESSFEDITLVIDKAIQNFTKQDIHFHELKLLEIEKAIGFEEYEVANELIKSYEVEMDDQYPDSALQLAHLTAELYLQQGDVESAIALLNKEISANEKWHEELLEDLERQASEDEYIDPSMAGSHYYNELISLRDELTKSTEEDYKLSTVEGKIRKSNGEPLSNVRVILRDESRSNIFSTSMDEPYDTVTGPDGSYSIKGVTPGNYHVMLGLLFEQVDGWAWPVETTDTVIVESGDAKVHHVEFTPLIKTDKPSDYEVIEDSEITFNWEAYPEAESYMLFLTEDLGEGGSISRAVKSDIPDNQITISVDELYAVPGSVIFSEEEWENVDPKSMLGFLHPEGTFSWYVHAFDEDGNMIGQSNGYRLREETMGALPFFHLRERQLTEADQLLVDGKIEEAYRKYEESIKEDAEDVHSLRMLTRLKWIEGDWGQEAVNHFFSLLEVDPNEHTYSTAIRYFYHQKEWEEVEQWYEKYMDLDDNNGSSYVKSLYSVSFVKRGQYEEGLALLYEVMEDDPSHRFVGYLLALELYFESSFEDVKELSQKYQEFGSYNKTDWHLYIGRLEDSEVDRGVITEALHYYFLGKDDQLDELIEGEPVLRAFIRRLDEVS